MSNLEDVPLTVRYYTFGWGHTHPETGESLANYYVIVKGLSAEHCRAEMLNRFGSSWAFEYSTPERAGVDRFGLIKLPDEKLPKSSGRWFVTSTYIIVDGQET